MKVDSDEKKSENSESQSLTSDEIMVDVLKQLKKLDADKKQQILDILRNRSDDDKPISNKNTRKKMPKNKSRTPLEDEVEILDMSEQKMGTYKRKRSMKIKSSYIFSLLFY